MQQQQKMNLGEGRYCLRVGLAGGVVLVDQFFKRLLAERVSAVVNKGIAWGLWPLELWGVIVLLVLLRLLTRPKLHWGWWLLIGGGLSNLMDRLVWGGVVDVLLIPGFLAFNLADVAVMGGTVWLVLVQLRHGRAKGSFPRQRNIGDR